MRRVFHGDSDDPEDAKLVAYYILGEKLGWQPSEIDKMDAIEIDKMLSLIGVIADEMEWEAKRAMRRHG